MYVTTTTSNIPSRASRVQGFKAGPFDVRSRFSFVAVLFDKDAAPLHNVLRVEFALRVQRRKVALRLIVAATPQIDCVARRSCFSCRSPSPCPYFPSSEPAFSSGRACFFVLRLALSSAPLRSQLAFARHSGEQ